jgi:competence ComEA-like helix-hairpin-helix protein
MFTLFTVALITVLFLVGMSFFTTNMNLYNKGKEYDFSVSINFSAGTNKDGSQLKIIFEGAVKSQKEMIVPFGANYGEAVKKAGLSDDADYKCMNFNYSIQFPGTYYIPKIGNDKISLNEASLEEFQTLPQIGIYKAELLIEYRQESRFDYIDEIKLIKGIGTSTFNFIKDYITL